LSLAPKYEISRAVIIGIDKYKKASPLRYAVNDATALAETLVDKFDFSKQNIHLLTDKAATKESILDSFLSFASGGTDVNDRVIFFFAGHGYTVCGNRGEVGFLVPYNGDAANLSTLIRWDELTRDADLIEAKHILFLMDACYGGLAISRALQPGSMRFLKDMLLRRARQVLAAGKADEVVADLGGPLPDHSVFTGHLLEALDGKAVGAGGVLTANGLMTYVYQKVAEDPDSQQTPHYGYLTGDGDLIFNAPELLKLTAEEKTDSDILISIPAVANNQGGKTMSIIEKTKEYLSEEKFRINLHDLVSSQIRQVLSATSDDHFPLQGNWSKEEFLERLKKYETATNDLCSMEVMIGYWGTNAYLDVVTLSPNRLSARLKPESGLVAWNNLRWYPIALLLYCGGIGAIAAGKYQNVQALFQSSGDISYQSGNHLGILTKAFSSMSELDDAFKWIPGYEQHYVPRSDYMFKFFQPVFDDLLFLGPEYERHFDRFEVMLAIEFASQYLSEPNGHAWGPVGRFGRKYHGRFFNSNPFRSVVEEAEKAGNAWPPIRAGLFGGTIESFRETVAKYTAEVLNRLPSY
jgi:hypothetical protein